MKLAPTLLVLAAFGVLLWVSTKKPADADDGAASHGNATHAADPHGLAPQAHGTAPATDSGHGPTASSELVKSIPATPVLPPPPRNPNSVVVTVRDPAGRGQPQIQVALLDGAGKPVAKKSSDAAGRVAFDGVAPGSYRVVAYDPDYLYTARGEASLVTKANEFQETELRVERGSCGLRGSVVDGSGRPLVERRVLLTAGGAEFAVNTDSKGRFLVNGLVAGNWTVAADGFLDRKQSVTLVEGATGEVALLLASTSSVEVELAGSHLHPAHFVGGEQALLRPATGGDPLVRQMELLTDGSHEHANVARARFDGLAPGAWQLELVDAKGASLIGHDAVWKRPVPLDLTEGSHRVVPLKTIASARGAGVEVPTLAIVFMVVVIGALMVATPILFPPPLVAKRPFGLQR